MTRIRKFNPKRHFRGNQYASRSANEARGLVVSASKKKLSCGEGGNAGRIPISVNVESKPGNVIVSVDSFSKLVRGCVACNSCGGNDCVEITEDIQGRRGLASKLKIFCTRCSALQNSMSSPFNENQFHEINIRLVYGMRCIGKGHKAAQTFCAIMDLPPPLSKFHNYKNILMKGLSDVSENSMKRAAEEAVAENDNNKDISVAMDGSWQKRGHVSLNGVVSATCVDTGKVIDIECLSKYCFQCSKGIVHVCKKNYDGTSGGMEAVGAVRIFQRSMTIRDNVRYVNYLGDGDSKGFMKVNESKPYGEHVQVKKLECVGHVQKRMGARLRRLRKDFKGKKLSDGKSLTGKGRLSDAAVDLLQTYYGLAIRRNTADLQAMRKAVWATFFHKLSNDENPQHGLCPKGEDSWCKFQKAAAAGTNYNHRNALPLPIMDIIKPIFRDLSEESLLKKCLHGKTQNSNESLNNSIWERIPKNVFVGLETLKIGVLDAVITFNDGSSSRLRVLKSLVLNQEQMQKGRF